MELGCVVGAVGVCRGYVVSSETTSVDTIILCEDGSHSLYPFVELSYPMKTNLFDV
jgi:hypothetical protein